MSFKGFFKAIKKEIGNEINKQLSGGGEHRENAGSLQSPTGAVGGFNMGMVQDVLGLLSGGGGQGGEGSQGTGVQKILRLVQKYGANLPGDAGKYLNGILKLAEVLGHGLGDDTPRNEKNSDGSVVDDFLRTLISGRKIFGGGGGKVVKDTVQGGGGKKYFPGSYDHADGGGQDYATIRAQCLEAGALFEDPEFQAVDASVFYSRSSQRRIYWQRPHQITENPQFFVDEASRFDVIQGELGDCWLLAAVANLTLNECTFRNVVPEDNSFAEGEYCGVFHFRFWQYGKWVDIVIDDQLPCDSSGKLLFMHSEVNNEFWSALLEKAYAKLYGSYEALKGGTTCEALVDFTGGVTELYDIQNGPSNLFELMTRAWERQSFLGCSIEPDPNVVEAATPQGLVRGHAYSITDIKSFDIETPRVSGTIPLLRIRNPWGNEGEWNGAWSDGSPEWEYIDEDTREEIGLTFDADGEFWMSNKDFLKYFQRVEICNLSPDSLEEAPCSGAKKWETSIYEGAWIAGQTAGGCRNYLNTFANNPQYVITLTEPDEGDSDGKCTVIIGLMQKNRREQRAQGVETLAIGFAIYPVDESCPTPLPMEYFRQNASAARAPTFINLREVSCRFKLRPGSYCIVPSTFEPNEEAEFILRVFSETPNNMMENE